MDVGHFHDRPALFHGDFCIGQTAGNQLDRTLIADSQENSRRQQDFYFAGAGCNRLSRG
jgi:hypothetical protein